MIRAVLAVTLLAACAPGDRGVSDDRLGGLVVEPKPVDPKVDVDKAALDPTELSHAIGLPYAATVAALGPHALTIDTHTIVQEAGADKPVSDLADKTVLELGDAKSGAFHGTYTNTADYGRETIFAGGTLYLRPRYQAWHARAPEANDEPQTLRDQYAAAAAATWELLAPGAELSDRGPLEVAGRAGRKIEVKLSPSPRQPPKETLAQRRWRESRTIESLSGEVVLDADKGVPLSVKLDGVIGFTRENRAFKMHLTLDAAVTKVGATEIAVPAAGDVVATPERLKEVDERDFILKGIAPPLRKGAADTTPPPPPKQPDPKGEPAKKADEPKKTKKSDDASSDEQPKKRRKKSDDEVKSDDASRSDSGEDKPKKRRKKPPEDSDTKSDATKSDTKSDASKSDASKPDASKSDASKSDASKSDTAPKSDAKPEAKP